jgi:hypothetical protein
LNSSLRDELLKQYSTTSSDLSFNSANTSDDDANLNKNFSQGENQGISCSQFNKNSLSSQLNSSYADSTDSCSSDELSEAGNSIFTDYYFSLKF